MIIVFIFICNAVIFAFDGNREGVILGLEIGYSDQLNFTYFPNNANNNYWENEIGPNHSIIFGFAPNENLEIYLQNSVYIHNLFEYINFILFPLSFMDDESILISSEINGIGCKYYFPKIMDSRVFFISGSLGIVKSFVLPDMPWYGLGIESGFGYEFKKHFYISSNLLIINSSNKASEKVGLILSGITLNIGALIY